MGMWAVPGFCHDWICKGFLLGAAHSCNWHVLLHLDTVHSEIHKPKEGRLRGLQVEARSIPQKACLSLSSPKGELPFCCTMTEP
jgi:hypothetical protein